MRTAWNLQLLYKSGNDPRIEKDVVVYEKACSAFEKKYKNKADYLKNENKLLKALNDYEGFYNYVGQSKAINYFYFRKDLSSTDQEAESKLNQLVQRLTKAGNKLIFFEIELGKINKSFQKKILKNKKFLHYRYFLEKIFKNAQFNLTEPEEKILSLKSLPGYSMWVNGQEKILNQQSVVFQGKDIPLPEAFGKLSELPLQERRELNNSINGVFQNVSYFSESEINAIYTDKKINDELRGFTQPYSATILRYQNDEKSVINFVKTVSDHFKISHRFYKLKAKLLNVDHLEYADRAAKIGNLDIKLSFDECITIYNQALSKLGTRYTDILAHYLKNGQIDVHPRQGKTGGAYCAGEINLPTYVLLNHTDNFRSFTTFAHEMGHAFHTELSKTQPPLYQHYTISVAEVASTFFENFAFDEVFERLSDKQKITALHDRINDSIATIFRQIACFNFELELHTQIRTKGALSREEIANLHNKHMQAYLGPMFNMKELDGYFFVNWSHLRRFFYVYSYAYGELISKALYAQYKKDPHYMKDIEKFLSAGGSKSPEQIFKDIGIDTSKPQFFIDGLKQIEEDIKVLEKLTLK